MIPIRVPENCQNRQHNHQRDQTCRDQFFDRIGAHGAHGVDLFGYLHRSEFGGNTGSDAPGYHQRSKHRSQFTYHRQCDNHANVDFGAEACNLVAGLQRQHHARKETGQQNNR